jgi:biotin carboxylase
MEAAIIPRPGTVRSIEGLEAALAIPGVRHIFMNVDIGDKVKRPRSNVEKAGHIIAVADTRDDVLAIIAKAEAAIHIKT